MHLSRLCRRAYATSVAKSTPSPPKSQRKPLPGPSSKKPSSPSPPVAQKPPKTPTSSVDIYNEYFDFQKDEGIRQMMGKNASMKNSKFIRTVQNRTLLHLNKRRSAGDKSTSSIAEAIVSLSPKESLLPRAQDLTFPPHTLPYSIWGHFPHARKMLGQLRANLSHWWINTNMLSQAGALNMLPGYQVPNGFFGRNVKAPIDFALHYSSRKTSVLYPILQEALKSYISLNQAIARRDAAACKELAFGSYYDNVLKQISQQPRHVHQSRWILHREITPTQALSVRSLALDTAPYKGRLDDVDPIAMQVLVRFDTEQSLEMYDAQGRALHQPDPNAPKDAKSVPAVKQRVTEYLVVGKEFWRPESPWSIREQWTLPPGMKAAH